MQFSLVHEGIPVGFVDLAAGELVAGQLTPLAALDPLRDTIRDGSNALLALGFFGAATAAGQNGSGEPLRAAAALQFDLVDDRGDLSPSTFVNVLESPDGGLVVIARLGHAHARVGAKLPATVRGAGGEASAEGHDPHR